MVILSISFTSTAAPLSECAEHSVNLILSKCHSTMHPHVKTLFSLLSLFMDRHLLLLLLLQVSHSKIIR